MPKIIVATDFSVSSQNAANYACEFAKEYHQKILLAHIYTIPAGYAAEGLSLVTVNDAFEAGTDKLQEELERLQGRYPDLEIEIRMMVEGFMDALQELNRDVNPGMIVMGAVTDYSDLWQSGNDWLNALLSMPCPVLVIPKHITFTPIRNIAFACDYKNVSLPDQINKMKRLVELTDASFYIVHVSTGKSPEEEKNKIAFLEAFQDIDPQFITIENKQIIVGISDFEKEYNIDLLLVIPRRHGLWYNLFNKSYSRQLALLNNLPVLSIH